MAFGNYTFSVNLWAFTGRVATRLQTEPSSLLSAFNVRDSDDAADQYVALVNEMQDWILSEVPALNQTTTTSLTLTVGTLEYPAPADIFRTDYQSVQFNDENDLSYRLEINFLDPADFRRLPALMQQETGIAPWPAFWTLDADAQNMVFTGFSSSWNLLMTYRVEPDPMVVADLNDDASTNYFVIPDTFIDALVLAVAIEIGDRIPQDTTRLRELLHSPRSPDQPGKLREMQQKLGSSGAAMLDQMATQGSPYTRLMPQRFAGVGRRRGFTTF